MAQVVNTVSVAQQRFTVEHGMELSNPSAAIATLRYTGVSPTVTLLRCTESFSEWNWSSFAAGEAADFQVTVREVDTDSMAASTDVVERSMVAGDTAYRHSRDAAGKMSWGPGSGSADTTLQRFAAGELSTEEMRISDLAFAAGAGAAIAAFSGTIRRVVQKYTVAKTVFTADAVSQAAVICALPAKTKIVGAIVHMTEKFALGGATLTLELGTEDDADALLVAADADAAAAVFGLVDGEAGVGLALATAVQGGHVPSWTAAKNVTLTLTSGTTHLGNGTATSLTTGAVTVYLETVTFP